jgi:hypothetical protein
MIGAVMDWIYEERKGKIIARKLEKQGEILRNAPEKI